MNSEAKKMLLRIAALVGGTFALAYGALVLNWIVVTIFLGFMAMVCWAMSVFFLWEQSREAAITVLVAFVAFLVWSLNLSARALGAMKIKAQL